MDRTVRAALLAALIAGGSVAFFGLFLGFPTTPTLITAVVLAVLSGALLWGAARRADTFEQPGQPPGTSTGPDTDSGPGAGDDPEPHDPS